MEQRHLGRELHRLDNGIRRFLCKNSAAIKSKDEVTGTNLRIIRFLKANEQRDIYQKDVEKEFGITRSTASRVLVLMEEKGLVTCELEGRTRHYVPMVERHQAELRETGSFLNKVYRGSLGLMVSAMAQDKGLTREEIDQLYEILKRAEEGGK